VKLYYKVTQYLSNGVIYVVCDHFNFELY